MEFRLPALGEGIESATVTQVLVKPGDAVSAGQPVLSVETDKAAMEVEADAAGTVDAVLVKPGDKLAIGAPVLRLSGDGKATAPKKEPAAQASGGRQPAGAAPAPAPQPGAKPEPAPPTGAKAEFRLPALGEG